MIYRWKIVLRDALGNEYLVAFCKDIDDAKEKMSLAEMEKTINNIYYMGAREALENAVIDLDIDKIRAEIGAVSGIGEKRLEQIMEIIQRNIKEADEKGEAKCS